MKSYQAPRALGRFLALAVLLVLAACGLELGAVRAEPAASVQGGGRVVVLGFDGADARTLDALRKQDPAAFPNANRLAETGSFEPLLVEAPPESPVSWAALNTGQNPAKTGVPGFVRRTFDTGQPGPGVGHIVMGTASLDELAEPPIPAWGASTFAAVFGALGFLVVFLFLKFLLRRSAALAGILGLAVAAACAWGGMQLRSYLPSTFPRTGNPNQARNFWDHAAEAGKRCVVLGAAQAFDMPAPPGAQVLAGLGVPDARGEIGNWFVYTTDPKETARQPKGRRTTTSGTVYRVDDYDGEIDAFVYGPKNFWLTARLEERLAAIEAESEDPALPLERSIAISQEKRELNDQLKQVRNEPTSVPLHVSRGDGSAVVRIGDQEQTVAEGAWSDYFEVTFEINPLIQVHAITRARIVSLGEPHFEMFLDVLHIDPRKPPFWQPISQPSGFSGELVAKTGLFETYGWPTLTMPFKDEEIAPEVLMEDVEFTLGWREEMVDAYLARNDWDCLFAVYSTTDRVQHMMYQYYDPEHPLYDADEASKTFPFFGETIRRSEAIPKIYEQMDRLIGKALDALGPDDLFLVCSDHGFQSFRTQVHVNNWLVEEGYLALKPGLQKWQYGPGLGFVDWSRTKAYSLGMGFVYLNQVDREPGGIVTLEEREPLLAELVTKLSAATDPATGAKLCNAVYVTSEIHSGDHLDLEGDLILGFAPPYRVSWSASAGGMHVVENAETGLLEPGPLTSDNTSPWSGGHVSMAVPDVAGVFLCNRPVTVPTDGVESLHIAPTILDALGVSVPAELDNPPLAVQ